MKNSPYLLLGTTVMPRRIGFCMYRKLSGHTEKLRLSGLCDSVVRYTITAKPIKTLTKHILRVNQETDI